MMMRTDIAFSANIVIPGPDTQVGSLQIPSEIWGFQLAMVAMVLGLSTESHHL